MSMHTMQNGGNMPDQKLDNLLNLALDATEEEREKSRNLNVGYEKQTRKWEIIVKHSGRIGVVPQKAVLFKGTIRSNLQWGKPDATEEEMWKALELAQASEVVFSVLMSIWLKKLFHIKE